MLIIPCAGMVGVNPNITFIKDGRAYFIYSCIKHVLSAYEVPVPGVRK